MNVICGKVRCRKDGQRSWIYKTDVKRLNISHTWCFFLLLFFFFIFFYFILFFFSDWGNHSTRPHPCTECEYPSLFFTRHLLIKFTSLILIHLCYYNFTTWPLWISFLSDMYIFCLAQDNIPKKIIRSISIHYFI